jgi:hypothetical protein
MVSNGCTTKLLGFSEGRGWEGERSRYKYTMLNASKKKSINEFSRLNEDEDISATWCWPYADHLL